MGEHSVFVTGGSGFLGRVVLEELHRQRIGRVVCLTRTGQSAPAENVINIRGDLLDYKTYSEHLQGCDVVLHMAALTGKAPPASYSKVNSEGTETLAREAARSGARRFIFVSSIAARFGDSNYYYGESKQDAERKVRQSGLDWTIVRPTMIFGKGSPVQQSLAKLALLPVIPIFGKGTARVQPVFVADLARFLVQTLDDESSSLKTIEVGGPETVTMESLIQMIRKARKGSYGPTVHLPIGPIASCLRMAEPILRPVLPFTAGQLASFRHDGVAEPNPLVASRFSQMKSLKDMIDDAA